MIEENRIKKEIASIEFCMHQDRDAIKNSKAIIDTAERNIANRKRSLFYYKNKLNILKRTLRRL